MDSFWKQLLPLNDFVRDEYWLDRSQMFTINEDFQFEIWKRMK